MLFSISLTRMCPSLELATLADFGSDEILKNILKFKQIVTLVAYLSQSGFSFIQPLFKRKLLTLTTLKQGIAQMIT